MNEPHNDLVDGVTIHDVDLRLGQHLPRHGARRLPRRLHPDGGRRGHHDPEQHLPRLPDEQHPGRAVQWRTRVELADREQRLRIDGVLQLDRADAGLDRWRLLYLRRPLQRAGGRPSTTVYCTGGRLQSYANIFMSNVSSCPSQHDRGVQRLRRRATRRPVRGRATRNAARRSSRERRRRRTSISCRTDTCARGAGDPTRYPATDMDGQSRPQGSIDAGPDEIARGRNESRGRRAGPAYVPEP